MNRPILEMNTLCLPAVTLGALSVGSVSAFTLELPWMDNAPFDSCIPPGEYESEFYESPKLNGKLVLMLKDVPGRDHIQMHPANFTREIDGCIAPGNSIKHLDSNAVPDVANSNATMQRILRELDGFAPIFRILRNGRLDTANLANAFYSPGGESLA